MKTLVRGFTLIELMVVVALISIMFAIAVPSFVTFVSNYRVTSAMNDFLQGVSLTRNEAMKRGRRVTMSPIVPGDWKSGWNIYVDVVPDAVYSVGTEELIFRHDPLPASLVVTNSSGGGTPPFTFAGLTYLSFDGTGYPRRYAAGPFIPGGIAMTDTIGVSVNIRTLCLAAYGRPRIVSGSPTCSSG